MDGTIQEYTLEMGADTKANVLEVKQCDTNSRKARIKLVAFDKPWIIPFGCQIHINVRKTDGTLANAVCARVDESTVMAPITEQMTTVTGTQLGELYFLGSDGDIKSQTFPIAVRPMIMDQARMESSDDFQSLQGALRQVQISTDMADAATQYATAQGDRAGDAAQRAEDAAASIQVAVDAAAEAKISETNAKTSETASAQTKQEVTDYVEAQKAAFVGYSQRESDSKYANALTATTTGEGGVTVDDAWTAPVLGLDVVGKSEQVATTGAQLQPFGYDTITHVGVTLTIKNDLVSLLGTATYSGGRNTLKLPDVTLQAGSYTISVSDAINAVMAVTDDANSVIVQGANIKELKFNIVKETSIHIGFNVVSGNVYNITGLRIMLNAGDTALPWEPYTGGAPSPSPEYPQDIISVGTMSTGAQMLDFEQCLKEWNSKYTQSSGRVYTVNALGTGFQNPISFSDEDIKVTLSGKVRDISGSAYRIDLLDSSGNLVGRIIKDTKSITGMASKIRLNFAEGGVGEYADIMLNAGDTALPWEPYTGGKPSPSVEYPQEVKVTATGAQLFYKSLATLQGICAEADITDKRAIKITFARGNGGKYAGFIVDDKINLVGKTLTVSYSGIVLSKSGLTPSVRLYWIDDNGSVLSYVVYVNKSPTTITIEDPQNDMATKLALLLYADVGDAAVVNDYVIYKDIMINAGDIPLPWEPYMGCQNVPITLTEPLRGVGEYRYRIMCRDGVWGIERCVGVVDNGQWKKINVVSGSAGHRFVYDATDMIEKLNCMVMCTKYTRRPNGSSFSNAGDYMATDERGKIFIRTLNPDFETIEAFKEFMADAITIYPLATPTWEPFPDATQQALNALTTYAGTTHLTITAGGPAPTVTLDYVQDTQKAIEQHDTANRQYTDNQIAAIVAALPTATQAAIVDNQTTRLLQEV